jgi:anti-sigma regulatory factor (Ser/Thr protein kinase)
MERTVPAEIRELPGLLDGIVEFLHREGLQSRDITRIQIAVDEAFSNIVAHGYRGGSGAVTLRCQVSPGGVEMVLEDRAPRFDPTTLPPPDRDSGLAQRRSGGLGVYLIRNLVEGVSYEYRDGVNILTMKMKVGTGNNWGRINQ